MKRHGVNNEVDYDDIPTSTTGLRAHEQLLALVMASHNRCGAASPARHFVPQAPMQLWDLCLRDSEVVFGALVVTGRFVRSYFTIGISTALNSVTSGIKVLNRWSDSEFPRLTAFLPDHHVISKLALEGEEFGVSRFSLFNLVTDEDNLLFAEQLSTGGSLHNGNHKWWMYYNQFGGGMFSLAKLNDHGGDGVVENDTRSSSIVKRLEVDFAKGTECVLISFDKEVPDEALLVLRDPWHHLILLFVDVAMTYATNTLSVLSECVTYTGFVVTTFSARNGCWAGIVDHSGKVFSILYQVKDGVVIGKEGNEIRTATQAPTVFIDHRFERGSQTCLSFSRDNPNVLLCCVPPAEFGGHFDLWHIDLEETMKRGKKSLVVSKEVPIPENIVVTGITAAEPVCVMSSTWAFNSTTGESHHYDNVLGVRAIGDRNIGAMHAEQPHYSIMDVYSTDNLNTVCLVSPVSGRHHGLHQSHEGCVVSLDAVQSHCGIVVWKVEQVTSATKMLFCDGATDVALATLSVD
ncbi:hypothetical protein Pelo_9438 [Pelomyxa schiedti]|nr:hypothetical protein Pelo_9438 [Pelomyxa schiedti]